MTEKVEYFISKFIIISFEINPINGGNPLMDNINNYIIITITKFSYLFHKLSIFSLPIVLNRINKGKLVIEYSSK